MSHVIMPDEQSTVAAVLGTGTQHPDGTQVRVLVVDDEPSLAELLSSVLRYEGWSVRTAGSGTEAMKAGREFRPDAVVLDIMLPDFDGLEVMRRMRAELPDVCVLFLTARCAAPIWPRPAARGRSRWPT
jgi:two-component system OmpR family response regulator